MIVTDCLERGVKIVFLTNMMNLTKDLSKILLLWANCVDLVILYICLICKYHL